MTLNKKRITGAPQPIALYTDPETGKKHTRKTRRYKNGMIYFPQGYDINTIEGAVPGRKGEVRLQFRSTDSNAWQTITWEIVDPKANFSKKFILNGLKSGKTYALLVEARPEGGENISAQIKGKFKTPPDAQTSKKIVFSTSTCKGYPNQDHPDGYKIYPFLESLNLDFFVHAGDIIYYDNTAKNNAMAYHNWNRMFSLPTNKSFHSQVKSYFEKDDHDTWFNDSYRGIKTSFMGESTLMKVWKFVVKKCPSKTKPTAPFVGVKIYKFG